MNHPAIIRHPSAFLPILMSLAALTLVLVHAAIYGVVHEPDEGTPAHIFQILMAAQLPLILFFAIKWLPQSPKQTIRVLALQAGAAVAALASIPFFT